MPNRPGARITAIARRTETGSEPVVYDVRSLNARALGAKAYEAWRDNSSLAVVDDTSFSAFWLLKVLHGMVTPIGELLVGDVEETMDVLHWSAMWASFGFPAFELTHGLTSALLLTDCRGVTGEDYRLPFSAFEIVLPYPGGPFVWLDAGGKDATARKIQCYRFRAAPLLPEHDLTTMSVEEALADYLHGKLKLLENMTIRIIQSDGLCLSSTRHWLAPQDSLEKWVESFGQDVEVDPRITEWRRQQDEKVEEKTGKKMHVPTSAGDMAALKSAMRLVVNMCLYISAQHPQAVIQTTGGNSQMPLPPAIGARNALLWRLGREIKLPREVRDAARTFVGRGFMPSKWRIQSRFTVRGHWRNQPFGPGRTERRRRWIAPYWKGPENASVAIERLYAVAENSA